jgi:uncharacterized membrane protein
MKTNISNKLTLVLIAVIVTLAILGVFVSLLYPNFVFELQPGVQQEGGQYVPGGAVFEIIYILLTGATDVLYLIGGGVVFFGGVLVTIRFIQIKLRDPDKPSEVTRHLSGYLTLGLAFFIGAEIVKTVVVRTTTEFELLILTIFSRGLFSLILYLERRWHGPAETE